MDRTFSCWRSESAPLVLLVLACGVVVCVPEDAHAYIGPGAGFAFLGSTLVFLLSIALGVATLLFWPLQLLINKLRGRGVPKSARAKRVVIVGLDGLDPNLVDTYRAHGKMPNFDAVASKGSYRRLRTTLPALSPVAWSSFQTGVNPGAHNIFDFLTRDKRFCLPKLSSTRMTWRGKVFSIFGRELFRWGSVGPQLMRGSQPFWKILGDRGIFSTVLRVPISYPPEPFHGNILSAMCTPDLRGTQGSFTYFTTRATPSSVKSSATSSTDEVPDSEATGGEVHICTLERKHDGALGMAGTLTGPPSPTPAAGATPAPLSLPFTVTVPAEAGRGGLPDAELEISGSTIPLTVNIFSPWVELVFVARVGMSEKRIAGVARFLLRERPSAESPHLSLYVSPLNIHPERPALPIAAPVFFSTWLAKNQGLFGTLGLMEDTWGRNEFVLDDARFLDQAYLNHNEREQMFFEALRRTRDGVCICVFDLSDRVQHMFWRYLDPRHHAPREEGGGFERVIPEMYERMDALLGKVRSELTDDDLLIVLSDHGFTSFRRGINLNTWLLSNGYLALKDGFSLESGSKLDYLQGVDWSRTRAYAVGLAGLYLNCKGRESGGIVAKSDREALKAEIIAGLTSLRDPDDGAVCISQVHDTSKAYRGIYTADAPDLIVGYAPGYRVSWESVTGGFEREVFSHNVKSWSGDHHVDPSAVPGILLTSRPVSVESPHIVDIAPTVLDVFRVPVPKYMEGQVLV